LVLGDRQDRNICDAGVHDVRDPLQPIFLLHLCRALDSIMGGSITVKYMFPGFKQSHAEI
jgi:hypothetical protein